MAAGERVRTRPIGPSSDGSGRYLQAGRIPFGWTADGANRNDSVLLAPTAQRRATWADEEIETIWLDRGYDSAADASPPCRGEDR